MMGQRMSTPVMHDKLQNTTQPRSKGTPDSAPQGINLHPLDRRVRRQLTRSTEFDWNDALTGCWSIRDDRRKA